MTRKNISYSNNSKTRNLLDVFYEKDKTGLPVIFFIHGGSWMSGSKDMYSKLGNNFLSKGFVSVIISYRLFPETDAFGMAADCQAAYEWCKEHISEYGGDPHKIYLTGHSAGGHLAAVTGLSDKNPSDHIAGLILIDAFGLSAWHFLTGHSEFIPEFFTGIFGTKKEKWPLVCPDKLLKKDLPPFLLLLGGNTYPILTHDNENFKELLKTMKVRCELRTIPSQSHMQMIYLFEDPNNSIYKEVMNWMNC